MGGKPFCCAERPCQILVRRNKKRRKKGVSPVSLAPPKKRPQVQSGNTPLFLISLFLLTNPLHDGWVRGLN